MVRKETKALLHKLQELLPSSSLGEIMHDAVAAMLKMQEDKLKKL